VIGEKALRANAKHKPKIHDVAIESKEAYVWQEWAGFNPNHELRMMEGDTGLFTDILLTEGVVNMFNYNLDQPMVIQIKHPDYYRYMRMIFDHVWSTL